MKHTIILYSLLFIFFSNSFAQIIPIDILNVYSSSNTIDSVYVRGTTGAGVYIENISTLALNDSCNTLQLVINFKGCHPVTTFLYDSLIHVGLSGNRLEVIARWDTLFSCGFPTIPMYTDTAIWDNCSFVGLNEVLQKNSIRISPNPASESICIENPKALEFISIEMISLHGKIVKTFDPKKQLLDIQDVNSGIYLLKFQIKQGGIIKKVFIE